MGYGQGYYALWLEMVWFGVVVWNGLCHAIWYGMAWYVCFAIVWSDMVWYVFMCLGGV